MNEVEGEYTDGRDEGAVFLNMGDGRIHTILVKDILPLLVAFQHATSNKFPIPEEIFEQFPLMKLFRDRVSASWSSGDALFQLELIDCIFRGPANTSAAKK